MKKLLAWIKGVDRNTLIRNSFLLPILSVVVMSISHVISWYDLGNPLSWAIYLSIAVEIFALASVSAASLKMKKGSIWLLFILVTMIQVVGNVFFTYKDIDPTGEGFKAWVELLQPWFEDWNLVDHKRLLAYIQGGTLPFMSLIALHFYIKFNENIEEETTSDSNIDKYYKERNERIETLVEEREANEHHEKEDDTDEPLIPDSVVKAELKKEQEKETKMSYDDIVQKVTAKPTGDPSAQYKGGRKENPGQNPQIMPGTN